MSRVRRAVSGSALLPLLAAGGAGCGGGSGAKAGDSTPVAADSGTARVAPDTAPTAVAAVPDSAPPAATPTPSGAEPAPTPAAPPRATPSETVMTGKVVTGGLAAQPVTSLQVEGGRPTTLVGPLEAELARLNGATVWVAGEPAAGAPGPSFTVTRYEIVSIDGAKPAVGTLTSRGGAWWLTGTDSVKLASVPAGLQSKPGAKVWIVGRRDGATLVVQSYGIIREP